jgi:hypothetical protein
VALTFPLHILDCSAFSALSALSEALASFFSPNMLEQATRLTAANDIATSFNDLFNIQFPFKIINTYTLKK